MRINRKIVAVSGLGLVFVLLAFAITAEKTESAAAQTPACLNQIDTAYSNGLAAGKLAETIEYTSDPAYALILIVDNATKRLTASGTIDTKAAQAISWMNDPDMLTDEGTGQAINAFAAMLSDDYLTAWTEKLTEFWCFGRLSNNAFCERATNMADKLLAHRAPPPHD